jgi:hypothetical protein
MGMAKGIMGTTSEPKPMSPGNGGRAGVACSAGARARRARYISRSTISAVVTVTSCLTGLSALHLPPSMAMLAESGGAWQLADKESGKHCKQSTLDRTIFHKVAPREIARSRSVGRRGHACRWTCVDSWYRRCARIDWESCAVPLRALYLASNCAGTRAPNETFASITSRPRHRRPFMLETLSTTNFDGLASDRRSNELAPNMP